MIFGELKIDLKNVKDVKCFKMYIYNLFFVYWFFFVRLYRILIVLKIKFVIVRVKYDYIFLEIFGKINVCKMIKLILIFGCKRIL